MTPLLLQLSDRLSRLWRNPAAPVAKRRWWMGGARANPDLYQLDRSEHIVDEVITACQRYRIRRRWQRDLRRLDDRQLRDIGVSRADAERAIRQFRFWI